MDQLRDYIRADKIRYYFKKHLSHFPLWSFKITDFFIQEKLFIIYNLIFFSFYIIIFFTAFIFHGIGYFFFDTHGKISWRIFLYILITLSFILLFNLYIDNTIPDDFNENDYVNEKQIDIFTGASFIIYLIPILYYFFPFLIIIGSFYFKRSSRRTTPVNP